MGLRLKVAGLLILTTLLVLAILIAGETSEIKRVSADLLQLGNTQTIQPSTAETEEVFLSIEDNLSEVKLGQQVSYLITYRAKKEIKQARLVAALGETKKEVYPVYFWNLNNLKAGASGTFTIPVEIKKGETGFAVSRVTISTPEKPNWWFKEKRKILATVDDVDKLISTSN